MSQPHLHCLVGGTEDFHCLSLRDHECPRARAAVNMEGGKQRTESLFTWPEVDFGARRRRNRDSPGCSNITSSRLFPIYRFQSSR